MIDHNEIIKITEMATGNALPWKVINGRNKQLPDDPKIFNMKDESLDTQKFDLIIANNKNDLPKAKDMLENHGKIYIHYKTEDLKQLLRTAHMNELYWAECVNENDFSHVILRKKREILKPKWNGQKGNVLLHCDWGWGDNIQFLRYCQLVKEKCQGKLILEVRLGLEDLCKNLKSVDQIIIKGEELPSFDFQCEIADLKTCFPAIPKPPYLIFDSDKKKKTFQIGCVWEGHHLTFNEFRFYDPNLLENLKMSGVEFFSFQKFTKTKYKKPPKFMKDLSLEINNWNDTANLLSKMNLLITVDTAMCHLSGAMNLKTWVVLPKKDYHSPILRDTEIWYPNTKLFINKKEDNWDCVFEEIKTQLKIELLKMLCL